MNLHAKKTSMMIAAWRSVCSIHLHSPDVSFDRGLACRSYAALMINVLTAAFLSACTTAVISGKVTEDGRPILWKNRDTSNSSNEVIFLDDADTLRVMAVVNAGSRKSIWMGCNEAGFCIENSISRDLSGDKDDTGAENGRFMKRALQTCRTVADFEVLLEITNQPGRKTISNYGVIDATGGAAIFETGNRSFTKFDANDPEVAPQGFLARSNFATTAHNFSSMPAPEEVMKTDIYSAGRYARACRLLRVGPDSPAIGLPYMLRSVTRDLADATGQAIPGSVNDPTGLLPETIETSATISRKTTVSAAVFHGVRSNESPLATTMWVMLGDPKFTIAVPCWLTEHAPADALQGSTGGPLGEVARSLRDWALMPDRESVRTESLPSLWENLWRLETQHIREVHTVRQAWEQGTFQPQQAHELHLKLAAESMREMTSELVRLKQERLQRGLYARYGSEPKQDAASKGPLIRVAIYDHSDGTATGPQNLQRILTRERGFSCVRLHPDDIREPQLCSLDLLIVPGGSASLQASKLGDEGKRAILKFVREGGGYVGICAGSYLATTQYTWSLGMINARVWDRVHWARGTGTVTLVLSDSELVSPDSAGSHVDVYYGQGPLLLPDRHLELPPYEVLAHYRTEIASKGAPQQAMRDTHAIIRSQFGDGRVVCISPHPEKPSGPDWIITNLARWAAGRPVPIPVEAISANE